MLRTDNKNPLRIEIGTFDGGDTSLGTIELVEANCDICGKAVPCIGIDNSQGEYREGHICLDCIHQEYQKNTNLIPVKKPIDGEEYRGMNKLVEQHMGVKLQVGCLIFDRIIDGDPGYCQCVGETLSLTYESLEGRSGPLVHDVCGLPLKMNKERTMWVK